MGSSTTLSIILKLVDEASASMASVSKNLQATGQSMINAGRTLTTDVTLPIVGVGVAAAKSASDFQSAMEMLVTQAGLPQDALAGLTKATLDFAQSGAQQAPEVLAQGLYHIVSLGVPAADAMSVLKLASEGAAMSGANLEDVSNALGAAVASNIKGSGDYNNAMAVLNATVGAGNMRMQDLATALGNVLPQATTAGLSLTDVGAAMATMTDNGMPAADAATRLHMAISLMEAPTAAATKALASIGITQLQLADDMRTQGLLPALQDLHDHLVSTGLTADQQAMVLSQAFGGGRTSGAIDLLLNNLDRVQQKYALINTGVGTFQQKVQDQAGTTAAQFAQMQASVSASMVQIGNALIPIEAEILPKLAAAVKDVADWFTNLSPAAQNVIIGALGLAAALGPVALVIGSVTKVAGVLLPMFSGIFSFMSGTFIPAIVAGGPWLLAFIALSAAIIAIANAFSSMQTAAMNAMSAGNQAIGVANSPAFQKLLSTATGPELAKLQQIQASTIASGQNALAIGQRYSGIGGGLTAITDYLGITKMAVGGIVNSPTMALIGEAGPEAVIPLSAFAGGNSLAGRGGGSNAGIIVNIMGGYYLDRSAATEIGNALSAQIIKNLRIRNYAT
jgi:TP901 family phage tail tape measure protein